jgi:hypothetical protein
MSLRIPACVALLLSLHALAGCEEEACRPGSLFLRLTFDALAQGADKLRLEAQIDGKRLGAELTYSGSGSTLQVDFPDGEYPAGKIIALTLIAERGGQELARVERPRLEVPEGCLAVELAFGEMPDLAMDDGSSLPDLALKGPGAPCGVGAECASGQCVDGVCCNVACTGQCEACDVTGNLGTCVPVPGGAPHGSRAACDGAGTPCAGTCGGALRDVCVYPGPAVTCRMQSCSGATKTIVAGCDGKGACDPVQTVTCPQGCSGNDCLGACMNDGQCSAADPAKPYCDNGVCTPKKPRGRACGSASECTSDICADGFCCNVACTGQCESCRESGSEGTCRVRTGAPLTGSTPSRSACSGSAPCAGLCNGVATGCVYPNNSTPCGAASCSGGNLTPVGGCNGGGACTPGTAGPCATNYCVSATACGNCPNDPACGANAWCDAGTCRAKKGNGGGCNGGNECQSGNCVAGICCSTTCSGTTPRCRADGLACVCVTNPDSCKSIGPNHFCGSGGACSCLPDCPGGCFSEGQPNGCGQFCPGCSCPGQRACCVDDFSGVGRCMCIPFSEQCPLPQ